jgi:UDPglucose 6-dehydrogenase
MIAGLLAEGASVCAFDPEAMPNVKNLLGDQIDYATDEYKALQDADALLICTEWGIFRNPNFKAMKDIMADAVIFDGRNLYELQDMQQHGFYYSSIGRQNIYRSL